jgi:hypothetical protein
VFHNLLIHGDGLDHIAEMSLQETLEELIECAEEFVRDSEETESKYSAFLAVGRLVMELLGDRRAA